MITHVAIRYQGVIYSLPRPSRHHHVIAEIFKATGKPMEENIQGFLNDQDQFLTRQEALEHALLNNQVKNTNDIRAGQLFSEDLW